MKGISILIAVMLVSLPFSSRAHDIYTQYRNSSGQLCCGGDPITGDCEGVEWDNVTLHPDGSASLTSRRYGGISVLVAAEKITWLPLPPNEKGEVFPAHWCGVPRTKVPYAPSPREKPENPDPKFWTYCAFIAPGGV